MHVRFTSPVQLFTRPGIVWDRSDHIGLYGAEGKLVLSVVEVWGFEFALLSGRSLALCVLHHPHRVYLSTTHYHTFYLAAGSAPMFISSAPKLRVEVTREDVSSRDCTRNIIELGW